MRGDLTPHVGFETPFDSDPAPPMREGQGYLDLGFRDVYQLPPYPVPRFFIGQPNYGTALSAQTSPHAHHLQSPHRPFCPTSSSPTTPAPHPPSIPNSLLSSSPPTKTRYASPSHLSTPRPENSSWSLRLPSAAPFTRLVQSAIVDSASCTAFLFRGCFSRTLPSKKDVRQLPNLNTSQLHVLRRRWDCHVISAVARLITCGMAGAGGTENVSCEWPWWE